MTEAQNAVLAKVLEESDTPVREREQIKQRVRDLFAQYEEARIAQQHDDAVRKLQRMSELLWVLYPVLSPMMAPVAAFCLCDYLRNGGKW